MQHLTLSDGWQFKRRDPARPLVENLADSADWLPASVPGSVHQDLLAAGQIPDPFVERNEQLVQWVGEADWLYRCRFELPTDLAAGATTALCCDGLDTFATVWLNGQQVLLSENMFVAQRTLVSAALRPGTNELWILFESAWRRGKAIEAEHGVMQAWNTDPSRVYVRKAQYHYGWDWGPCLITAGPWRAIRLETYQARIADLACPVTLSDDLATATLAVSTTVESGGADALELALELFGPAGELVAHTHRTLAGSTDSQVLTLAQPELWWPRGYGAQARYRLVATLGAPGRADLVLDRRELPLGLRRVELQQEPVAGESGSSFVFAINNTPVFCGGANWIPADSFTPRVSVERYRTLLTQAAEANMLMLRIWGGGIYEADIFYELCDELGLLVWQDFMFACGRYPAPGWFQASVRAEAESQVRRLRHYASLVLWCGNNEDYQLVGGLGLYDPAAAPDAESGFPARVLYEQLLPEVCAALDPTRPYWPGSPFGGSFYNDTSSGDRHTWDVWHGAMAPYQDYPRYEGRFVSEFGMAALPDERTIALFASPPERTPQSPILAHHHKAGDGERRLNSYLSANICIPDDLPSYIYASQFVQAEAMRAAYVGWRRRWGTPGSRAVAGALVWQLEDCWPAISWALVDYALRPKPAYYAVRRALAPVAVGLAADGSGTAVWAVNATVAPIEAELELRSLALSGEAIATERRAVTLAPNQTSAFERWHLAVQPGLLISVRLLVGSQVLARFCLWPEPFKDLALPDPDLQLAHLDGDRIQLSVVRPAKGVWLSADHDLAWSDNMLDLLPGDAQIISAPGLQTQRVAVCSLFDLFQDATEPAVASADQQD